MGNESLIRGAALAAPQFLDIGKVATNSADKVSAMLQQIDAKKESEKNARRAKVENYLSQMPSGIELSKIPPQQQGAVEAWSRSQKMKYAEAAKNINNYEVGSEEYIDAQSTMTGIKSSFVQLDNNLTSFKANKTEYLKSSSEGALSNGNNGPQSNILASIYTDETGMSFDSNGNLSFVDQEGNMTSLNDVPDFFNKDFQSADALINMNSNIYNSGQKLDGPQTNMYRQKVTNMVKKGGRETVLSLATDDLIQQGGLGIVDQDLLTNPERHAELEQAVIDNYMNILKESADVGFQKKQKTKSSNSNTSSNVKYGQATRDDLNIYEEPVTGTYNDIQGKLKEIEGKGLNDPIELQVTEINKIMKSNNSSIPDLVIQDGKVYIPTGDGNGTEIDIFNNDVLVDYVINNMGKGIGDDAKMILKRKLKGGNSNKTTTTTSSNTNKSKGL